MEAELERLLRATSARTLSATAGGTNYRAQAIAVAAYIERLMCAECRDDVSATPSVALVSQTHTVSAEGARSDYVLSVAP